MEALQLKVILTHLQPIIRLSHQSSMTYFEALLLWLKENLSGNWMSSTSLEFVPGSSLPEPEVDGISAITLFACKYKSVRTYSLMCLFLSTLLITGVYVYAEVVFFLFSVISPVTL
jgi:hypothetical protein